jgi:hypothetical protein
MGGELALILLFDFVFVDLKEDGIPEELGSGDDIEFVAH